VSKVEKAERDLSAFERFEKFTKALVAVPRKELQKKLDRYKKEKIRKKASLR